MVVGKYLLRNESKIMYNDIRYMMMCDISYLKWYIYINLYLDILIYLNTYICIYIWYIVLLQWIWWKCRFFQRGAMRGLWWYLFDSACTFHIRHLYPDCGLVTLPLRAMKLTTKQQEQWTSWTALSHENYPTANCSWDRGLLVYLVHWW